MEILNQYLFQHRNISIPGLGTLHMDRVPARTDFVNRQLLAPGYIFRFDKYFDAPDTAFFTYLSSKMLLPDFEAIRWYNEFAYELRARIRNREKAYWEGLGEFRADDNGEVFFEARPDLLPPLQPVPAHRIIRERTSHQLLVGDTERTNTEMPELLADTPVQRESWRIYALVIAAIALGLCLYHFAQYGMNWSATGNSKETPEISMPATSK